MTEYLTPDTPDLLDIRLAWQSLGYNDQAFEFLLFVTHVKRSKVFAGQGDYELEAHVGSTPCSVSPNRCQVPLINHNQGSIISGYPFWWKELPRLSALCQMRSKDLVVRTYNFSARRMDSQTQR